MPLHGTQVHVVWRRYKIDSEKSGNDIPHIIGTVWGMGSVGAAGSTGVASDESIFCSGYSGGC